MKVLIIARQKNERFAPFITEQVNALEKVGIECKYYGVRRNGFWGYLMQYPSLLKMIHQFHPDLIHAHYGLCGVLANLQRRVPVVTTYHGSDINDPKVLRFSRIAIRLSRFNIFVSSKTVGIARPSGCFSLIPCGINLNDYPIVDRDDARRRMGLTPDGRYALFAGAFDNPVKNAPLAKESVGMLPGVNLIELKGYTREQVSTLMQAVDVFLMTSLTEGSPQVIKEAMACGCPIVSVDVGDVKERMAGVDGCYVSLTREPQEIADLLKKALSFKGKTKGRERVLADGLDNVQVAKRLMNVYYKTTHINESIS